MSRQKDWGRNTRQRVAIEAARVMAEEGIRDFHAAKRKAASRLSISDRHAMPSNTEIEHELRIFQELFRSDEQPQALRNLRRNALEAMNFLARFKPRLVGPVLDGTADKHSHICLHVFANTTEEVTLFLMENHIPYEMGEVNLRANHHQRKPQPCFRFMAADIPVEIVVFDIDGLRQAPLSPVDRKPMQRANIEAVRALLDESNAA